MPELVQHDQVLAEPKIDLHLHLDGALSPEAIWKIAQDHGIEVPGLSEQSLKALKEVYPNPGPFDADKRPEQFNAFLAQFGRAFSVMQTPETIYTSTLEVIRDLKRENIVYAELRFAPSYHTQQGQEMNAMVEAVLRAMKEGERETGVMTKLIVGIPREIAYIENYNGPTANQIVDTALEFQDQGVVAIDLTCSEHFGPGPYVDAFQRTVQSKLRRTVHAGEAGKKRRNNILTAIEDMHANGIGHALPLPTMPSTMEAVKESGIRIERAPISNQIMTVGDEDFDNIKTLIDRGILVSVNSDDPGVFGPTSSLTKNLLAVANRYTLGMEGVRMLTRNAALSAFISEEEREALAQKVDG